MSELQNVSCLGGGIQFWKDFIKIYENSCALWDTRSMSYKKPYLKREAYNKLRDKLREIDPNVSVDYVKRRINGLRTCYRRELRRIQESKRRGDDLYRPTLFYFKEMGFLDDVLDIDLEREAREGRTSQRGRKPKAHKNLSKRLVKSDSSSSSDGDTDKDGTATITSSTLATNPMQCSNSSSPFVTSAAQPPAPPASEAQALGASWVALYYRLERDQQLYANKAIMEVLYQGALGRLHADSYRALDREMCGGAGAFALDDHHILEAFNEELAATDFITKEDVETFYCVERK